MFRLRSIPSVFERSHFDRSPAIRMKIMRKLPAAMLLAILVSLCYHTTSMTVDHQHLKSSTSSFSRRQALCSVPAFLAVAAPPAHAVQPRNEALCNTGFFTNIGQWYCTPIGNIADEGKSGDLSKQDDETADSLMSKLGVSESTSSDEKKSNESAGGTENKP